MTGQKFGKLLVKHRTENPRSKSHRTYWLCECDCGNESIVATSALRSGKTTQCWDCAHKATAKAKHKSIVGMKYGKLTVQNMIYGVQQSNGKYRTYCECICECGNVITVQRDSIMKPGLHSCGCAKQEISDKQSKNIIGQRFGRLVVLEDIPGISPRKVRCVCDCGAEVVVCKRDLLSHHTTSCGCYKLEQLSARTVKDWTGYVSPYGVKAIKPYKQNKARQWLWEYECPICHNNFVALPAKIASGQTTSCGCRVSSSKEDLIKEFLEQNHVVYIRQYSFDDCRYKYKLKFDFAIFKNDQLSYLIEYDGAQHTRPIDIFGGEDEYNTTVIRDRIKNDYCREHHIPLLRLDHTLSDEQIKSNITNIIYP